MERGAHAFWPPSTIIHEPSSNSAAHLASLDARQSGDQDQLKEANQALAKWQKYG
jgi:hypothetical protein